MINLTPELIEKTKPAKTAEELLALAKENGVELTTEEANAYFMQLNPKSGELSDDELDDVAGGGCDTEVDGKKYTVVSSGLKCFNGQYEACVFRTSGLSFRADFPDKGKLRTTWAQMGSEGTCSWCLHLKFDGLTGYCGKS